MNKITQKRKSDKVTTVRERSVVDVTQIVRGALKEGYANISIQNLGNSQFKITKWNMEA